ncbi:hypothetical protein HK104_004346 [Borealophlyctis nickersoniae]|nr:hypothetical protein HK104_004346 [Borealophlyctis nickersoniae]
MCAIASRWSTIPEVVNSSPLAYQRAEPWLEAARMEVMNQIEQPSLDACTALCLMGFAYAGCSHKVQRSVTYQGMSQRMAIALQLNVDPDELVSRGSLPRTTTWFERERRRRLWWAIFVLGRVITWFGRIEYVSERVQASVCLPAPEALWESVDLLTGALPLEHVSYPHIVSPTDPTVYYYQLMDLFLNRIVRFRELYESLDPLVIPGSADPQLALDYATALPELDAGLRSWFNALPPWIRDIESHTNFSVQLTSVAPPPWMVCFLHILYHSFQFSVHRICAVSALRAGLQTASIPSVDTGLLVETLTDPSVNALFNGSVNVVFNSLVAISDIISRKILPTNPHLLGFPLWIVYFLYQHACLLLTYARAEVIEWERFLVLVNPILQTYRGMSLNWCSPVRYHNALVRLMEQEGAKLGVVPMVHVADNNAGDAATLGGLFSGHTFAGGDAGVTLGAADPMAGLRAVPATVFERVEGIPIDDMEWASLERMTRVGGFSLNDVHGGAAMPTLPGDLVAAALASPTSLGIG